MSESIRNTKKSRLVSQFTECVVDLVASGVADPSKSDIVDCVVNASLGNGVTTVVKTILEDEMANELDRYFNEVIKSAGSVLDLPYHQVTAVYYDNKRRNGGVIPETKEEAMCHIACEGNGAKYKITTKKGKTEVVSKRAAGVRFITNDDAPDIYMRLLAKKKIDNMNIAIDSTTEFVNNAVVKGALPNAAIKSLPSQ